MTDNFNPDFSNSKSNNKSTIGKIDTDFTPAFNFDKFEPEDFELSETTKIPEFEPPELDLDQPKFESEPLKLDLDQPKFESEPLKLDLDQPKFESEPLKFDFKDPDFGLDSFEPLASLKDNDSVFEPDDSLSSLVTTKTKPTFKSINVTKNKTGGSGSDSLTGNNLANTIEGLGGNDVLEGLGNNDRLIGGEGNDFLTGGVGKDTLIGVDPYDPLAGRGEYDGLVGGLGADAFLLGDASGAYYTGNGSATIWDFSVLGGDSIQLTGSASEYSIEANQFGDSSIFRGLDLIAVAYDAGVIPSTSLDFV